MIRQNIVNMYAHGSKVDLMVAEKDVILTYVLKILSDAEFSDLVFKGGTCIRKIYLGRISRFSEDLDFQGKKKSIRELVDGYTNYFAIGKNMVSTFHLATMIIMKAKILSEPTFPIHMNGILGQRSSFKLASETTSFLTHWILSSKKKIIASGWSFPCLQFLACNGKK